jgi:hypothetical protein
MNSGPVLLHPAQVRLRQPLFEFRRHHRAVANIQLFQERKPVFTKRLPFSPSSSRFKAIVSAECVYATPFSTFDEEVIFLGLAVRLQHCDWFAIVQANGHGGCRRRSGSFGGATID